MELNLKLEIALTSKQFDRIIELMNKAVEKTVKAELDRRGLIKDA